MRVDGDEKKLQLQAWLLCASLGAWHAKEPATADVSPGCELNFELARLSIMLWCWAQDGRCW